jgi:hypothetical protein
MRLPCVKLPLLILAGFLMQASPGSAQTVPVTIQWPEGAGQTYSIRGITPQPMAQSGTYQVPDGRHLMIVTTGCEVAFDTLHGKVKIPFAFFQADTGVRFDPKTSTFTFLTREVRVDLKDFDEAIAIDSPEKKLTAGVTSWKLVPGIHTLVYGTNKVPFNFTADGFVTMQAAVSGITSRYNTITIRGMPEILAGSAMHLLPGQYRLPLGPGVSFAVDDRGWLGASLEGPFAETLALEDRSGNARGVIMIPDGDKLQAQRLQQEKADQALRDRILAATEKVSWKQDFTLRDKMKIWDWSEQQVHYPVALPAGTDPAGLQLLAFTEQTVRAIPFQLSDDRTTLYFRTELPSGATRLFRLLPARDIGETVPKSGAATLTYEAADNTALISNGLLTLKVPVGHHDFPDSRPFAKVAAPILGIKRDGQSEPWSAVESFEAPDSLRVTSMEAKMLATGPVFSRYQVTYHLTGNRTYTTTLELRAGETHASVAEAVDGFSPGDKAFIRLDYGQGLCDPDRRLITAHLPYSGNYDQRISTDDIFRPWATTTHWLDYTPARDDNKVPRLDIRLGLYVPNTLGVLPSTTFYREDGDDALLLSIDKPEQWKESTRQLWTDYWAVETLRFYQSGPRKYMETQLAGPSRFWAVGVIPRNEAVLRVKSKVPGSPDAWMCCDLGMWNLQAEVERSTDWNEDMSTPAPFDAESMDWNAPAQAMSFEDYTKLYFEGDAIQYLRDFEIFYGHGIAGRQIPSAYRNYILSRAQWTPEQRDQVRQVLVYLADLADGDWVEPHHSMLAGHPNFIMDVKQIPIIAAAAFPNHPKAKQWRDSFLGYAGEWFDRYTRKDVPELNTKGGRWTENICCYWGQSLTALLEAEMSLKSYDGTSIGRNPDFINILRWMQGAFMSPHDGVRMVPPEGAHSHSMLPGGRFWRNFFRLCEEVAPENPQLAREMKWIETNGKEGAKPDVRSALYTDYGPVFHYDFGGPHESYAHLQNIHGLNYRWDYAGIVYYGARNKAWSYNTMETNGDDFDWDAISDFTTGGRGLDSSPTDQLLYDFDFAQFYRVLSPHADSAYRARALMLLRDDYLVLADEVSSPAVRGTFNWVSVYDLPQFYQLKPGAPPVDHISRDPQPPRRDAPDRIGKVRSFTGQGDFLTVVAPAPVAAKAESFGATINGEYVFASQKPEMISEGPALFSGNYGYARAGQLALFQGTKIGLNGFVVSREGGDFGLSAIAEPGRISGRIVGRSGGNISITPPSGYDLARAAVVYDGQPVPHTVKDGAISFSIAIAQKDGLKNYAITF